MAIIKYKDPVTGDYIPVKTKSLDTLPVGTEVDFDGNEVPSGWTEVADYSTNEIDTGKKWIDNKKIYRIVINDTTSSTATNVSIASNVDKIINAYGFVSYPGGTYEPINYHYDLSSNYFSRVALNNASHIAYFLYSSNLRNRPYYVVLEYTKVS